MQNKFHSIPFFVLARSAGVFEKKTVVVKFVYNHGKNLVKKLKEKKYII